MKTHAKSSKYSIKKRTSYTAYNFICDLWLNSRTTKSTKTVNHHQISIYYKTMFFNQLLILVDSWKEISVEIMRLLHWTAHLFFYQINIPTYTVSIQTSQFINNLYLSVYITLTYTITVTYNNKNIKYIILTQYYDDNNTHRKWM